MCFRRIFVDDVVKNRKEGIKSEVVDDCFIEASDIGVSKFLKIGEVDCLHTVSGGGGGIGLNYIA